MRRWRGTASQADRAMLFVPTYYCHWLEILAFGIKFKQWRPSKKRKAVAWASQWTGKPLGGTPPEISRIRLPSLLHSQQASGFCYICFWVGLERTDSMSVRTESEDKNSGDVPIMLQGVEGAKW